MITEEMTGNTESNEKSLQDQIFELNLVPPTNNKLCAQILALIKAGRPLPRDRMLPLLHESQLEWYGEHVMLPNIAKDDFVPRKHLGYVAFVMPAPRNKQRTINTLPYDNVLACVITPTRRHLVHVTDLVPFAES